jgi:hypothetical protein
VKQTNNGEIKGSYGDDYEGWTYCLLVCDDVYSEKFYDVSEEHSFLAKSKVKFTLERITKAQRGNRGVALLFL